MSLGKRLALDCQIKTPAIEVGAETVALITERVEAATAALDVDPVCEDEPTSSEPGRGIADRVLGD